MPDDWHKIERGLFESADGQWRIANPYKLTTELRHRWLVAQRRSSGSGWCMHDGDHATLHEARAYVERLSDPGHRDVSDLVSQRGGPPMNPSQTAIPQSAIEFSPEGHYFTARATDEDSTPLSERSTARCRSSTR